MILLGDYKDSFDSHDDYKDQYSDSSAPYKECKAVYNDDHDV